MAWRCRNCGKESYSIEVPGKSKGLFAEGDTSYCPNDPYGHRHSWVWFKSLQDELAEAARIQQAIAVQQAYEENEKNELKMKKNGLKMKENKEKNL